MRQTLNGFSDTQKTGLCGWTLMGTVILAALFLTPSTALATDCSIATYGEPAYERVKEKIKEKLPKIEQFTFQPYNQVEISENKNCRINLNGRFSFKKVRSNIAKSFSATLTPKAGAPHGMRILQLKIRNP